MSSRFSLNHRIPTLRRESRVPQQNSPSRFSLRARLGLTTPKVVRASIPTTAGVARSSIAQVDPSSLKPTEATRTAKPLPEARKTPRPRSRSMLRKYAAPLAVAAAALLTPAVAFAGGPGLVHEFLAFFTQIKIIA